MRLALTALALAAAAGAADAQSNEDKRAQKLKAPFLSKAPWIADYDKARAEAKKTGRPIFTYFTTSYEN